MAHEYHMFWTMRTHCSAWYHQIKVHRRFMASTGRRVETYYRLSCLPRNVVLYQCCSYRY